MFNYAEVQQELAQSTWPAAVKQRLGLVLPQLGQFTLSFVSSQLAATGSELKADIIAELVELEPKWYESLNTAGGEGIAEQMADLIDADSELKAAAVLAIITDIRTNPALSNKLSPDLSSVMSLIEIIHFSELDEKSALALISDRLHDLIQFCDLYMEIKRYCYYRSVDEIDYGLLTKIEQAIMASQLIIGNEPVVIGKESFSPTVQNWLKDYIDQASDTKAQNTFTIAGYMSSSDPAKKLNNLEQSAVTSVIKLYTWLHQPRLNEAEILVYEAHREIISPAQFLAGGEVKTQPEPIPEPQPQPIAPMFKIPLQGDLDLSTRQRSGLVFDQPTNIDLNEEGRLRAEEQRNQAAIQAKLEALKQRSGVDDENNS